MFLSAIILFLVPFAAAFLVVYSPFNQQKYFKHLLTFSGSYLFSTTLIHILPEMYELGSDIKFLGIIVLLGFILQMLLEMLSSGIEHGHAHIHFHENSHNHNNKALVVLISLVLHSFVEGMIVIHPSEHHDAESHSVLIGLLLHKVPEAFALASSLIFSGTKKWKLILYIFLYALASPIGLIVADYIQVIFIDFVPLIFAIVAGSFLYLSTTIFFEQNPTHRLKPARMMWFVVGATLAIINNYLF